MSLFEGQVLALPSAPSSFSFGLQKVPIERCKLPEDSHKIREMSVGEPENDWAVAGTDSPVPTSMDFLAVAVKGLHAKIELLEIKMKSNHQEVMDRLDKMEAKCQVKPLHFVEMQRWRLTSQASSLPARRSPSWRISSKT